LDFCHRILLELVAVLMPPAITLINSGIVIGFQPWGFMGRPYSDAAPESRLRHLLFREQTKTRPVMARGEQKQQNEFRIAAPEAAAADVVRVAGC
jgi:hypothetical protein